MITSYLLILNDTDIDILNSLIYSPDLSDIIPDTRIDHYRNYKYPLHRVLSLLILRRLRVIHRRRTETCITAEGWFND